MDFDPAFEPQLDDSLFYAEQTVADRAHDNKRKGLRREDKPFRPCLTLRDASGEEAGLGLPCCADPVMRAAIHAIVANLIWLEQMADATWTFYSRDTAHYVGFDRYVPRFYRRQVMIEAVELMQRAGLIYHQKIRPSPNAWCRSRFRPTEAFLPRLATRPAATTAFAPCELIVLRDADGRPIPYRETRAISAMRQDVLAHNAYLAGFEVTLNHPEARCDTQGMLVIGKQRLNPQRSTCYRVFNDGKFTRGGRWYGPWWQHVPSDVRTGIHINGEPTCESDIAACHLRLLGACAGVEFGDRDPYDGLGFSRDDVKACFNIMLNASRWRSASGALIERLSGRWDDDRPIGPHVQAIRTAIQTRFPALERFWNTGYGLLLQNIDAQVCAGVQRRLREAGVPALSIHDSFIVPQPARDLTVSIRDEEFDRACHAQRQKRRTMR
jgi:hypothetical protein